MFSLKTENEIKIVIEKSKFIAYIYNCNSLEEQSVLLKNLKREHLSATHICYAYVYSIDKVLEKVSDDGEPKGTAGAPIMNVIKKRGCKNILIAVVRYFGGIKLGAGGLVRAYSKTAGSLFN